MKLFLAISAFLFLVILSQFINAQVTYGLNIDNPKTLYNINYETTKFAKVVSPNSQIYLPDTLLLYSMNDSTRISASYTQDGFNSNRLTQLWYNGHWVNYLQTTWSYFNAGVKSLELKQYWLNGQWINTTLDSSTFDANGNMLVHLYKYWYQGVWKDSILSSRTYNTNGNLLTNEGWYMTNNQWTNHDRSTYTYDSDGNELTYLFELWISQWVNVDRYTYSYDINGKLLTILRQAWNGQWNNATLSTYTYDADGNMISYLFQISANGQWTNSTIHTYTYDVNRKMLTDWLKGWTNGSWMNGSLYTYTYDANGNMINELIQYWLNGLWTNTYQTIYTYDLNGNMLTGNNTIWSVSSWVPADYDFAFAVSGSTYSFTGYRIIISWILINLTDVATDGSAIIRGYSLSQNYPNPFNPSTVINYELPMFSYVTLKVYDLLGREIKTLVDEQENAGNYFVSFDASSTAGGLPSGIYFYQIQAGNFIQTRKLVLLK
jgi:hypothetical protein